MSLNPEGVLLLPNLPGEPRRPHWKRAEYWWAAVLGVGLYFYPSFWLFVGGLLVACICLTWRGRQIGAAALRSGRIHALHSNGAKAMADWLALQDAQLCARMIPIYIACIVADGVIHAMFSGTVIFCVLFSVFPMTLVSLELQAGAGVYTWRDAKAALGKWAGATAGALGLIGGGVLASWLGILIFSNESMKSYLHAAEITAWTIFPVALFGLIVIWLMRLDVKWDPFKGGNGKQLERIDRALAAR